ncbi:MAG: cysteine desulfurase family protein [Candidatus Ranarchaeia archaeon]|jgi:cysteine desulfurase
MREMNNSSKTKTIYLDYSAGSPVDKDVLEIMHHYNTEDYGNPTGYHQWGYRAKQDIIQARKQISRVINTALPKEIIFTSSPTESNNLAINGIAHRYKKKGNHIITLETEHLSILNPLKRLQREGYEITKLPVDKFGLVDLEKLKESITDKTILITIQTANLEIGSLQPIKEIGEITKDHGIVFHSDGTASVGYVPTDVQAQNLDLLTLPSNGIHGPKGIAGLYVKAKHRPEPLILGGDQERGLRASVENTPGIMGMAKAYTLAIDDLPKRSKIHTQLRDDLITSIPKTIPNSYLNGHPTKRLPNNIHFRFDYIEGESLTLELDDRGIAVSTGAACAQKTLQPSHVVLALGVPAVQAQGLMQVTFGRYTTKDDIEKLKKALPEVVKRLRILSPLTPPELRKQLTK